MIGLWEGYYTYDKKSIQQRISFDKTFFKITIDNFENNKFKGTVVDDLKTGGTPGIGEIVGEIQEDKIIFVKNMPVQAIIGINGLVVDSSKKHRPIYYEGRISNDRKVISGTWQFKFGCISSILVFILAVSTKGKWTMTKSSKEK